MFNWFRRKKDQPETTTENPNPSTAEPEVAETPSAPDVYQNRVADDEYERPGPPNSREVIDYAEPQDEQIYDDTSANEPLMDGLTEQAAQDAFGHGSSSHAILDQPLSLTERPDEGERDQAPAAPASPLAGVIPGRQEPPHPTGEWFTEPSDEQNLERQSAPPSTAPQNQEAPPAATAAVEEPPTPPAQPSPEPELKPSVHSGEQEEKKGFFSRLVGRISGQNEIGAGPAEPLTEEPAATPEAEAAHAAITHDQPVEKTQVEQETRLEPTRNTAADAAPQAVSPAAGDPLPTADTRNLTGAESKEELAAEPDISELDAADKETATIDSAAVVEEVPGEEKKGFFARLRDRLGKTKDSLVGKVRTAIFLRGKVDEELLEEIEEILIQSDVGVATTTKIVDRMRKEAKKQGALTPDAVLALFKDSIEEILKTNNRQLDLSAASPMIVLMVGVNGTGKTTTIGKIAQHLGKERKKVMMIAADTFRAAATDQLAVWAERTKSVIVRQPEGSDPASVVYEGLERAKTDQPDVILIDTAGRLHTKLNLMEELKKIVRVIKKHYPDAPHETILVLDATTGQNAVNQVRIFHEVCALSGLIMTKLDGTAKGGILIACKDEYDLPVFKIGIGEGAEDLRDFDPHDFVEALFSNGKDS